MKNRETIKEAAKNYGKIRNELDYGQLYCNSVDSFKAGAKWQQEQDKKLYSEEEVKSILFHRETHYIETEHHLHIEKWFKQFKKS